MEEWKECTLSDLGTIVGGATPSTKDSSNYENGSIAWITPKDLSTHTERFISHGERNITEKGLKSCSAQLMPPNSILFTSRAPIGYIAIAKNEVCTNQGFKSIVPNKETDFMFLYYLLKYNKDNIENLGSGTTFKEVSGSTMRNVPVKVPPLPTQQKIAAILSSLDDKIELNNKINTNLEQQAQALFKNWYVDFEPFGGKMPEGWKTISLEEFCSEIVRGHTPNYVDYSDRPILNQKVNKGFNLETQYYKYNSNEDTIPENKYANFGDVLLNSLGQGTLGRTHLYRDDKSNIIIDQFITVLRTNSFVKSAYLEFVLSSEQGQKEVLSRITGSTGMWVLTINNIRKIPIVCPNDSDFKEIETIITNIYKTISGNVKENYNLATIRDTLLPKLMNGKIEV